MKRYANKIFDNDSIDETASNKKFGIYSVRECKQTFCMVTKKQINDHPAKCLEPILQLNTGSINYQACIQVPEREVISCLVTIAKIDRNHATIQLTLNLKGSYPATFHLTLRLGRVFMHLSSLFSRQ